MSIAVETQLGWLHVDELVELCRELTSIPSPNPPGDTSGIVDRVRAFLTEAGVNSTVHTPQQNVSSLVCVIEGKAGDRSPSIVLNGHLDTFPVAETGWSEPAFPARRTATRIYGPGVTDMRAGLTAILAVAGLAISNRESLNGRLVLALAADEETGGRWGTEWLLDKVQDVRDGDICVVTDQNGIDSVSIAEKGFAWLRIEAPGVGGHGAYASSTGAYRLLLPALSRLLELETDHLWGGVKGCTVNVGKIEGGVGPNLAPPTACGYVDIRFPPGHSSSEVVSRVRDMIRDVAPGVQVEVLRAFDSLDSPVGDPHIQRFMDCARRRVGAQVPAITRAGTSDARFFRRAGIPTVLYGPSPHNMGAANDYLEISDLVTVTATLADFVAASCRTGPTSEVQKGT